MFLGYGWLRGRRPILPNWISFRPFTVSVSTLHSRLLPFLVVVFAHFTCHFAPKHSLKCIFPPISVMASFSSILLFIQFSPLFAFYMIRPLELEDILAMQAQQEMEEDERELASRWRTLRQALLRSEDPLGKLEMDMMDGEEDGERPHNALTVLMVPDDDEDDGNMLFEDDDGPKLILNDGNEDGEEEDWIWVERPKEDENNNKKMFILQ